MTDERRKAPLCRAFVRWRIPGSRSRGVITKPRTAWPRGFFVRGGTAKREPVLPRCYPFGVPFAGPMTHKTRPRPAERRERRACRSGRAGRPLGVPTDASQSCRGSVAEREQEGRPLAMVSSGLGYLLSGRHQGRHPRDRSSEQVEGNRTGTCRPRPRRPEGGERWPRSRVTLATATCRAGTAGRACRRRSVPGRQG